MVYIENVIFNKDLLSIINEHLLGKEWNIFKRKFQTTKPKYYKINIVIYPPLSDKHIQKYGGKNEIYTYKQYELWGYMPEWSGKTISKIWNEYPKNTYEHVLRFINDMPYFPIYRDFFGSIEGLFQNNSGVKVWNAKIVGHKYIKLQFN